MTKSYLNHTRNERGRYRDALHWLRMERTPEYAVAGIATCCGIQTAGNARESVAFALCNAFTTYNLGAYNNLMHLIERMRKAVD